VSRRHNLPGDFVALRQKYKKSRTNLVRIQSHLSFISECYHTTTTPKGLKVNVQCHALLKDLTEVGHRFDNTKSRAEREFVSALHDHYLAVREKLRNEVKDIELAMQRQALLTQNRDQVKRHEELLQKTVDNITKEEQKLGEKKKRKMELMNQPRPKKNRDNNRNGNRGTYNNTNSKNGKRVASRTTSNNSRSANHNPDTQKSQSQSSPLPPDQLSAIVTEVVKQIRAGMQPPTQQLPPLPQPLTQQLPPLPRVAANATVQQLPPLLGQGVLPPYQQPPQPFRQDFMPWGRLPQMHPPKN